METELCPRCTEPLTEVDLGLAAVLKGLCLECAQQLSWEKMTPEQRRRFDNQRGN